MASEVLEQQKSTFDENIQRGIDKKILSVNEDNTKVTYFVSNEKTYKLTDPEEKVRASYFVELVLDYQYPINKIAFEVTVPRRTPNDWADIVVYEDEEKKKPYLVVECKKDGITEAEFNQAIEQAFGNANSIKSKLAIVVAGNTRTAFDVANFKPMERVQNIIADIPVKYNKVPKYKYIKGEFDLKIISREELIQRLETCHDTVWQGGKLAPTTAFDEVSKLLFCKLKDEKDNYKKGDVYKFQIGTNETPLDVYNRVDAIYQKAKQQDAEVFKGNLNLEPEVVHRVVEHIQGINFTKTDLDTKGVAFERFMQDFFKGKMGQFFTPRNVVQFVVKMMGINNNNYVLDPCCGSGGFLLNALDSVRKEAESEIDDPQEQYRHWHDFAKDNLFGIEINDQIARVCKMNMIIHDDGHTNVISRSSLDKFEDIENQHKGFKKDHFDIIVTNPPFGATVKSNETDILPTFELGGERKNQKTEILFIERCVDFLKPKTGKMGIVLPDGLLTNSSMQYIRDFILRRCQLLAVVSLPQFAFSHYGAAVKSSLIFLRRKKIDNEDLGNYPIFMATAEDIGYDTTGKELKENDLEQLILPEFMKFLKSPLNYVDFGLTADGNKKCFKILSEELTGKRIDPRGHQTKPREIINKLKSSKFKTIMLKDLLLDSFSGEWGEDSEKEGLEDYTKLNVFRNKNFDNEFNLNFDDVTERLVPNTRLPRYLLKKGDILVEKSGGSPIQPVGRVALIEEDIKNYTFSNFLLCIRVDETKCLPEYLFITLKTIYNWDYMRYIQSQTTGIINLIMEDFLNIPIPLPQDINIQEKIAKDYFDSVKEVQNLKQLANQKLRQAKGQVGTKILGE